MEQSPIPDTITVCITSCARLDLLAETLRTFRQYNPGGKYLISEDSTNPDVIAEVKEQYPEATVLSGPERLGIMKSIDRLYSNVTTPYIFHLEDDWQFDGPIDWNAAIELLEADPKIANVCVRAFDEIKPKYQARSTERLVKGQTFRVMNLNAHPEYYGWSPNPGVLKLSLYEEFKPFGRVQPDTMSGIVKAEGRTMAFLLPGVARHLGYGRNVVDPTIPARPKNKLAKLARSFKKKLYYAGLRKEPF